MVDVVRVKPPERSAAGRFRRGGLAAFAPFNQKASSRCRSAAGAAGGHLLNNHKMQDPKAGIGRTLLAGPKLVTSGKAECSGTRRPGKSSECA
jgi:hypothetical protein